ncbi:kinase-like protein [Tuber magnatum]|uniref:Kinase-like protein n=1 Tax=Tuber magnatum TaxID=42249 RepID=A0A317T0C5_9PEZI|nr:kinase-like protein [Tuber magnatum]
MFMHVSGHVAIKLIRRDSLSPHPNRLSKINREISILRTLSHPNIVRLHEMVETDRHIGIILEYASGGELFDYILTHRFLKDPPACRLFAQLVSGVGYLHKKGIVHRDLKLENLLLDRNRNIIITDFGFANVFDPKDELGELEHKLEDPEVLKELEKGVSNDGGEEGSLLNILGPGQVRRRGDLMATSCGSPCYAAPELVVSDGLYTGRKVDVWSCGVILYAMLAGYLPFDDDPANPEGDNINLLYKYIVSTPLTFPEYVSPHARDLLRRMLVPEPRKRADLFEVARHSWLSPFANVVSLITSSTTGVKEVEHVTINEPTLDVPSLMRSASVREPSSTNSHPHPTSLGGLGPRHHAHEHVPQATQSKPVSDAKRRTVQVEYVEPISQTKRGSAADPDQRVDSEDAAPAPFVPTNKHNDGVTRATTTASVPSRHQRTMSSDQQQKPRDQPAQPSGSSAQPPRTRPSGSHPQAPTRAATTAGDGAGSGPPSRRPSRDKSGPQFSGKVFTPAEQANSNSARPNTANSINSNRLPSRGSYSRPVAPSLAANNAQGRIAMPKGPKPYTISHPIPQRDNSDAIGTPAGTGEMGKPSTTVPPAKYSGRPSPPAEQPAKGHKRANTIGGSGGAGRFLGGFMSSSSSQDNASRPTMTGAGEPRPSLDQSGRSKYEKTKEGKGRRFSILPTSFSLRSISGSGSEGKHERRPSRSASGLRIGQFAISKSQPQASSHPQLSVPNAGDGGSVRTGSDTSLAVGGSAPASATGGNYGRESIDLGAGNANSARRPAVLQKNRKFTEGDAGGTGGSSGPARRVMDFFRRRGVARSSKGDA